MGWGLSYTNFTLAAAATPEAGLRLALGQTTTVDVQVANVGALAGDEVVLARQSPSSPRLILPNFSVLARACLWWCVGAPIWV